MLRRPQASALLVLAVVGAVLPLVGTSPVQAAGNTVTVTSSADAYVSSAKPKDKYGGAKQLRVSGTPTQRSYLRFPVKGITGTVVSATLTLRSTGAAAVPLEVRLTDGTWKEKDITWETAPTPGSVVGAASTVPDGNLDIDVTSAVTGNGDVNLAVVVPDTSAASTVVAQFGSREDAKRKPTLTVTTSDAPPPPSSACAASGDYSTAVLGTAGLAAYWRLGDTAGTTACDALGTSPGTYNKGYSLGATGAIVGDANTAVTLDGRTGYVKVPDDAALSPSSRLTVEGWVDPTTTAGSRTVIRKDGQYLLRIVDGTLVARVWTGSTKYSAVSEPVMTTGAPQHVAMTYDGTTLRVFRNGLELASTPVTGALDVTTRSAYLGTSDPTYDWFAGTLDEVALYGTALSPQTIADHYRIGTHAPPDGTAPAAPTNLRAQAGDRTVALSWTPNGEPDLAGYRLYQRVTGSTTWTPVHTLGAAATSYTDTGLTNGTSYDYQLTAFDTSSNESAPSTPASAKPTAAAGPCGASGDYSTAVLGTAGLAAYWRLGESTGTTACDARGTSPGTYKGGYTLGAPGALSGDPNTAVTFDGSTGFVKVPNTAPLNPASAMTAEGWVEPTSTSGTRAVIRKGGQYLLRLNDTSVQAKLWWSDGTTTTVTSGPVVTPGAYQHLAVTYDGTAVHLYRNGVEVAAAAVAKTISPGDNSLNLGASWSDYDFFGGTLDDIALYTAALSAGTIADHYRTGSSSNPPADTTPPAVPANLKATAGDGVVSLTWDAGTEADLAAYRVYRRPAGGAWPTAPLQQVTGNSFLDNAVTNGTTYDYRVTAVDTSDNESGPSGEVAAKPTAGSDGMPPATPENLHATSGDGTVSLTWNANVDTDLASYNVYRRVHGDAWPSSPLDNVTTNAFTDNTVTNSTSYDYRVTAVDASGNESVPSESVTATPSAGPDTTPPATPQNLQATAGDGTVSLTWNANTEPDLAGYQVFRRESGTSASPALVGSPGDAGFTDTSVTNGTSYDYQVAAVDASGNPSAPTAFVSATPDAGPCDASSTYSTTVLSTTGLAAYWRLGDRTGTTACDALGASQGTYNGGVTLARPGAIAGDRNTGVAFDGSTGYVRVPNKPALSPTSALTVEAWARPSATPGNQTVIRKDQQYLLRVDNGTLVGRMWFVNADGTVTSTAAISGPVVTTGSFQHLAMTYDGTAITVYRNGVQVASTAVAKPMAPDSTRALFMGASDPTYDYFNGVLDEEALYSTALTADQIADRYRVGAATDGAGPQELSSVGAPEMIGLTWSAVAGATRYHVYQRSSDGTWPSTPLASTGGTSYVAKGLVDGQSYAFRVTATVTGTESRPSAQTEATPRDDVLLAAGDIADSTFRSELTAQLLDANPGQVMTLGDNAYPDGTASDFATYYDPTWGRHLWRTRAAIGNHDYATDNGAPYWAYFGDAAGPEGQGYYSYDQAGWHVVVLNSNCSHVGGCTTASPQGQWLSNDLASSTAQCTLAVWHHPLFSSGNSEGTDGSMRDMWSMLMSHGAEVVLSGHDHAYERFKPQDADGNLTGDGLREFIVGTGGGPLHPTSTLLPNSAVRITDSRGILRLDLDPTGYTWRFLPVDGGPARDSGTSACH